MFSFIQITEREYEIFNQVIADSIYSSIYQSVEWGEFKRKEGWYPSRYLICLEKEIVGGFQVLEKKLLRYRILYIPRGPVINYDIYDLFDILNQIADYFRKPDAGEKLLFLRINPDLRRDKKVVEKSNVQQRIISVKNPILHTATFRIDLTKSEQEIYDAFESRTRYDIRKAQQKNVKVIFGERDNESHFNNFYILLNNVSTRQGFPIYSYELMKYLWSTLSPKGMCQIVLSEHEGEYISGAFLLIFGGKVIYQWGGSIRSQVNPNQLMQWEIIKWAKSAGYKTYDLQGVPEKITKTDALWGVYLFKRGFGGEYVELAGEFDCVYRPYLYFVWQSIEPIYPKLKRIIQKIHR